jgi:hypothetical protein
MRPFPARGIDEVDKRSAKASDQTGSLQGWKTLFRPDNDQADASGPVFRGLRARLIRTVSPGSVGVM